MKFPRWYTLFCTVLALNVVVVLSTSLWKLAVAADTPVPLNASETSSSMNGDDSVYGDLPGVDPEIKKRSQDSLLNEIPLPSSLPDVPSLADPETLEKDPIYQEFKSMFGSNREQSPEMPQEIGQAARSLEFYSKLDQRLTTVRRLTQSAQSIASEASSMSQRGESKKAGKLLNMATSLREMAAELLIDEF